MRSSAMMRPPHEPMRPGAMMAEVTLLSRLSDASSYLGRGLGAVMSALLPTGPWLWLMSPSERMHQSEG